jgi:hypothetical protein
MTGEIWRKLYTTSSARWPIGEKVYGWDHLDVATWANNIGMFSA